MTSAAPNASATKAACRRPRASHSSSSSASRLLPTLLWTGFRTLYVATCRVVGFAALAHAMSHACANRRRIIHDREV